MQTLSFARDLYSAEAVDEAVKAYAGLAQFAVSQVESDLVVQVSEPDPDVADVLADEFCNHVLNETVRLRQKGQGQPR
jgi:hypothetical protein